MVPYLPLTLYIYLAGFALTALAAIAWGRAAGAFLSVGWALGLAFFVLPPVYSLRVADPVDVKVLGVWVLISLLVSQQLPPIYGRHFRRSSPGTSPYTVEYHLTPGGWVRGSEWFVGILQAEVEVPPRRAVTLIKRVCQRPGHAALDISWSEGWRDRGMSEQNLMALRSRFPLPVPTTDEACLDQKQSASVARHPAAANSLLERGRVFLIRVFGWGNEPYAGE